MVTALAAMSMNPVEACLNASTVKSEVHATACAVYYESRGEDRKGKIAVANVVQNRMTSPNFPDTAKDVVYQNRQFSWVRHKKPAEYDRTLWRESVAIAVKVLTSDIDDVTHGSLFFSNDVKRGLKIGNHWFRRK